MNIREKRTNQMANAPGIANRKELINLLSPLDVRIGPCMRAEQQTGGTKPLERFVFCNYVMGNEQI